MRYRITTESGSIYSLDTEKQEMIRLPGAEAESLKSDFSTIKYAALWYPPEVGRELLIMWQDDGNWPQMRITTPLVEVEEIE